MISRYNSSKQVNIATAKRWNGSKWVDATIARRWDGSKWVDLLPTAKQYVKTYEKISSQMYWNSGEQDNQSSTYDSLIHGTYSGGISKARRSLIWFSNSQIRADLAGAKIDKVELYLYREDGTHGSGGAGNVYIKTHNYSSEPSTWTGSDSGAADSGTPTLKRGAGAWFTLLNSVGENLRDSKIQGIALDADSSTSITDYVRFARNGTNAPKLRITYTK